MKHFDPLLLSADFAESVEMSLDLVQLGSLKTGSTSATETGSGRSIGMCTSGCKLYIDKTLQSHHIGLGNITGPLNYQPGGWCIVSH